MRIAASEDGETFGEPVITKTPVDDFDAGMQMFAESAKKLTQGEPVRAAAGGISGPLDTERSMLVGAPNIADWDHKPLKRELEKILGAEVFLENDTAIVGLGEAHSGAGKGEEITVYITVSTGVGGARYVGGKLDRSRYGFEIGHHIISAEEGRDLESYISGRAFRKRFGKQPYEVHDSAIWDETARLLAIGLNNAAVFWSPDIIILGGSMIVGNEGPVIPLECVQEYYDKILTIFPQKPRLVKAALGDLGGLHGALAYIKQLI